MSLTCSLIAKNLTKLAQGNSPSPKVDVTFESQSNNRVAVARTADTIWLEVKEELNRPTDIPIAPIRNRPKYPVNIGSKSGSPNQYSSSGKYRVKPNITVNKDNAAKNLPSTISTSRKGAVSNNSSVPSFCSSAKSLIVRAGAIRTIRKNAPMGPMGPNKKPLIEASGNLPVILKANDRPDNARNNEVIM